MEFKKELKRIKRFIHNARKRGYEFDDNDLPKQPKRITSKKLEEIKESWQIYAIFEDARKAFNAEFDELKKDKEKLIESFNATSAKNAMLLAQNKELEAKNKALLLQNRALESLDNPNNSAQETQNLELLDNPKQDSTNADSIHREKAENTESQNIASLDSLIETQDLHTLNDLGY